jgi:Xaa-Pro dipeptidase
MKVPGVDEAKIEKTLYFPQEEYRRRLACLREQMRGRSLDALLVTTPENICYLSGYQTPGYYCKQCLLVPAEGDAIHVTRATEETNAKALSWIEQTTSYMDDQEPVELFAQVLGGHGFSKARIGVEKQGWFFPVADLEQLQGRLADAAFVDGSMLVEACRLVKSDAEIAYILQAAQAACAGMQAGIEAVRVGVNEDGVAAEVQRVVTAMGSEYPGLPIFVASGVRTSYAHATWSGRRLEPGDPVLLEISGCYKRYSGALMRSGTLGEPSAQLRSMADAAIGALDDMLKAIRPDRPLGEVWEVWARSLERRGFQGRFKRTGYSIGVNFPPDWGEGHILSFKRGEQRLLKENMTFHIPSIVKIFGLADSGFSETVRVTHNGCALLTNLERKLFVR